MVNTNTNLQDVQKLKDSLEDSYLLHLAVFADSVDRYIDIYLKTSLNWLKILSLIMLAINDGSLTPSELGRKILRPKDSITKLVTVLVKEGLVKRYRKGKDRRSFQIKLTEAGYSFVYATLGSLKPIDKSIESSIGRDELRKLFSVVGPLGDWFSKNAREQYY